MTQTRITKIINRIRAGPKDASLSMNETGAVSTGNSVGTGLGKIKVNSGSGISVAVGVINSLVIGIVVSASSDAVGVLFTTEVGVIEGNRMEGWVNARVRVRVGVRDGETTDGVRVGVRVMVGVIVEVLVEVAVSLFNPPVVGVRVAVGVLVVMTPGMADTGGW